MPPTPTCQSLDHISTRTGHLAQPRSTRRSCTGVGEPLMWAARPHPPTEAPNGYIGMCWTDITTYG